MKAIISGATGAVGVSLIEELLSKGWLVTAVARPNSKRLSGMPKHDNLKIVECDIAMMRNLIDMLPHDYDAFYHFAWDGTYGDSRQNLALQTQNILYSLDAVHVAHVLGCKVFIGAGSQSEFGHVSGILYPDMPCNPDNGYGIAKLTAGWMTRLECQKLGIRHIWCRIISMYGPHDNQYTLIMTAINGMLRGEKVSFSKGDQIWDYIYNKDAARAFRLVAEKGRDGAVYCFGTGKTRRLADFIRAIRDEIDPTLPIGLGERPYYPNQVMHLEADISNLTADTGFVPKYSFEEGIRETIEWAKECCRLNGNQKDDFRNDSHL